MNKLSILLLGFAAACAPAFAGMVCTVQPPTPIKVRVGGLSELLPDLVVTCTGGSPTPAGQEVPLTGFGLTLNTTFSNRVLFSDTDFDWTESLLLVDEPAPNSQRACIDPDGVCTILGTGTGAGTYNGAVNRPNVFQGQTVDQFILLWILPVDEPGPNGVRTFRITNLRANTLAIPDGLPNIQAFFSVDEDTLPANMATTQTSLTANALQPVFSGNRLTSFTIHTLENIPNVFKPRSSLGAVPANQNVPGSPPNFETGFRNAAFPISPQGDLSKAGLADTGTRVIVRLDAVPAGVTVTVPTSIPFGLFGEGVAQLVVTDTLGGGAYQPAASGIIAPDGTQRITAVYEFTQSLAGAPETFNIPFTVNYGSGAPSSLQILNGSVGLGPLSSVAANSIPSFDPVQLIAFQVAAPQPPGPLTITTTTLLPAGFAGTAYSTNIIASGGTAPYVFSFVGAPPPGLSLNPSGVLSGTPSLAGTFSFSVKVMDAVPVSISRAFTLVIAPGPQNSVLQLSSLQLDFVAPQAGSRPPVQSLTIESTTPHNFTITTDGGPNLPTPSFLTVTFPSTTAPGRITVSANQGTRTVGTYTARILVGVVGSTAQPLIVNVTLTVVTADPQLTLSSNLIDYTAKIATPTIQSQTIQLFNTGGGGSIAFTTAVVNQSTWIKTISPPSGSTNPNSPTLIRVDIDTALLHPGYQTDIIRFTYFNKTLDLAVRAFATTSGAYLQLSRSGVYFRSNVGSLNLQTQKVRILDLDQSSSIAWTATVLQGGEWLSLSALTGVSTFSAPGPDLILGVKAAAGNLAAGPHYALVKIDAPNTMNAPQYIMGVLDIQTGTTTTGLDFDDAGFVLTALTGSTQAVSHTFTVTTGSSASSVAFSSSVSSASAGIFSISTSGSVNFTASTPLTISANPANVAAGIYTAEIPVATAQGVRTLAVTLIVADAVAGGSLSGAARSAACVPNVLSATQVGLTNSFSVPAGWPTALVVDLRNNCGTKVLDGTVVASFSNGDPPLTLAGDGASGLYSATWQPVAQVNPMAITIHARTAVLADVSIPLTGGILPNAVPVLFRNGTVHNLDPKLGGSLSPGLVAAVYGANLASVIESTTDVPLPPIYKGTQVLIGPYTAPLFFVSPGQLNVQVPSELVPNQPYSVVVSANGALTVPDTITLVPAVPGIAYQGDGKVIAQHNDFATHPPYPFVVTATDPAKRDEYLIVYLVGLGITNPVVATGAPSPAAEPLGRPVVPVTVTLGGQPVEVPFVGLTPFAVGLFQINLKVPSNAPLNTPLDLVIKQGGLTANISTLTIAP